MLNKGAKGQLAEAVESEADLYRSLTGCGNDSIPPHYSMAAALR